MTSFFDKCISILATFWKQFDSLGFEMYGYNVSWTTIVAAILIIGMFLSIVVKN